MDNKLVCDVRLLVENCFCPSGRTEFAIKKCTDVPIISSELFLECLVKHGLGLKSIDMGIKCLAVIGFYMRFEDDSLESAKNVKQWNVKIISVIFYFPSPFSHVLHFPKS